MGILYRETENLANEKGDNFIPVENAKKLTASGVPEGIDTSSLEQTGSSHQNVSSHQEVVRPFPPLMH
jgi:hypothetical protein